MAKHSMYKDSPKMEHDEDGKVKVKKSEKHADKADEMDKDKKPAAAKDIAGVETSESHAEDIKEMHKRHHTEFRDMHARHETEMKSMHTKHQKTAGATGGSTVDAPIAEIEKGAKA